MSAQNSNTTQFKFTSASLDRVVKDGTYQWAADTELKGLAFKVKNQTFFLKCRVPGVSSPVTRKLGKRSTMGIKEAHAAFRSLYQALASGNDPKEARKQQAVEKTKYTLSFHDAYKRYCKENPHLAESTKASYFEAIKEASRPGDTRHGMYYQMRDFPLFSITRDMVKKAVLNANKSNAVINRSNRTLRLLWNYFAPVYGVTDPAPTGILNKGDADKTVAWKEDKRRQTLVEQDQLGTWFNAVREIQTSDQYTPHQQRCAYALELNILLGFRKNEVNHLRWCEIDFDGQMIVIPPQRSKNGTEIKKPITGDVLRILEAMQGQSKVFVFKGAVKNKPIHDARSAIKIVKALTGMHRPSNDLRRVFATASARVGSDRKVTKTLLGHKVDKSGDVTEGYQVIEKQQLVDDANRIIHNIKVKAGLARNDVIEISALMDALDDQTRAIVQSHISKLQVA